MPAGDLVRGSGHHPEHVPHRLLLAEPPRQAEGRREGADPRRAPAASAWPRSRSRNGSAPRSSPPRAPTRSATSCACWAWTTCFDSRSLAFADDILAQTAGQGVDVVLNSLAGEAINRNLRVLKRFGRFLELGKRDFYENTKIGLRPFRNNISYFGIDADQLMQERPDLTRELFAEVIALFEIGVLHPAALPGLRGRRRHRRLPLHAAGRQIGKVVVTYRNGIRQAHAAARSAPPRLSLPARCLLPGHRRPRGLRPEDRRVAGGSRRAPPRPDQPSGPSLGGGAPGDRQAARAGRRGARRGVRRDATGGRCPR